jgi:hypothetical protein
MDATPSTLTIADGRVNPDTQQMPAAVGQGVILNVKSDVNDQLHSIWASTDMCSRCTQARRRLEDSGCVRLAASWWSLTSSARPW